MSSSTPRVGVAVFVINAKSQFIIGKRKGSHGAGTLALPGGHLEFGESFEECARREVLEETGLTLMKVKFWTATNDIMANEGKHYITIFMTGEMADERVEAQVMEPDKCEKWEWISWTQLEEWETVQDGKDEKEEEKPRLFLPLINLIRQRPDITHSLSS